MRSRMGCRLSEVLKFSLAVSFGFSICLLMNMSHQRTDCPRCPKCPPVKEQDLIQASQHTQLRVPFKPRTMYEVIRYEYFNSSNMINNLDENPKTGLLGHQKSDLKDILNQAMALFNSGRTTPWEAHKLLNGYRRFDPLRGEEYILDLEILKPGDGPSKEKVTEMHRFELVKPFGVAQLIEDVRMADNKMIHFILPVSSSVLPRFQAFLKNFEEVCLKTQEHVYLMVVLFGGKSNEEEQKAEAVKTAVQNLTRKYRKAHIRVIQTGKEFSRALGLDLGAKQLPSDVLLFFCDIDVTFTRKFLSRCRLNAVHQKQVYYPIVFAQYDPEIAKKFSPADKVENLMEINKYTGHWVHYGYGMACMYNIDYRTVGGLSIEHKGWGGEDVELYTKHVKSSLSVFRAMDPGLIHLYHNRSCNPDLPADQLRMCIDAMAEAYGSRTQLAKKLLMPH